MNKFNHSDFKTQIEKREIDVFLTSASFEDRCFVVSKILKEFSAKSEIFCNTNEYPEIVQNAESLKVSLTGHITNLNTQDPVGNYLKIFEFLQTLQTSANILIDSTTFTHETLLVLLRLIEIFKDKLGNITICYVGADAYSTNIDDDNEKWLSKGISDIRTVIGYSGITDPTKKNHLLVLFGFESERTKKLIDEYQFDEITLGFGDQAIDDKHLKINYERHSLLLKEYKQAKGFKFCLIDPSKTKEQILQYISQPEYVDTNTVIAPLNNKLSTIGAGLAAIANQDIQIAYAQANVYNVVGYSTPSDDIYICDIRFSGATDFDTLQLLKIKTR